ncbi:MAG: signal peptidase II [Bacillales bacterium]|nr:signal peptidase II [Bacillales bacterium]
MLNKIKDILKKIFIEYYGLVMIFLFVLDIVSKVVMEKILTQHGSIIIFPFFDLSLVYNQGAFFGMLGSTFGHIILILISILGAVVMFFGLIKYRYRFTKGMIIGLVFAIPGNLGNLVDRCIYNFDTKSFRGVIDFFHFHIDSIGFDWAVFNVADVCLVIGIICFTVFYLIADLKKEKAKKKALEEIEAQKRNELKEGNIDE